ncbi:hypothetical protein ABBQ38_010023 [Trebouxia sp. C0009 RCD-2024]
MPVTSALAHGGVISSFQRPYVQARPPDTSTKPVSRLLSIVTRKIGQHAVAVGLSAAMLASCLSAGASEVMRFPASANPAVFAAQQTLVEAWTIVGEVFVDARFAGHNWDQELTESLTAAYSAESGENAYREIAHMLSKLGDPFTRVVPPREYADFRVSSDGEVQGVGLLIAQEPSSGRLVVLAPIRGGPADKAGVLPGDEVVSIDGQATIGWNGDQAAQLLRGRSGSSVIVRLARRTLAVPGVPARPEPPLPRTEYRQVQLQREKLELNPVFSTAMQHGDHMTGYIRLVNFSQKAAPEMRHAIADLQERGCDSFILDLRNNPGGLVRAGLDIARLWLPGEAAILTVEGRDVAGSSAVLQRVVLEAGSAMTNAPLAVLVNGGSASASEILAGALHDNHRATLIGDQTFGKGKIQSVFELEDGSALFVTVAKYRTPNLTDIDHQGLHPDQSCAPLGISSIPGAVPITDDALAGLGSVLALDSCVLTAEGFLDQQMGINTVTTQEHGDLTKNLLVGNDEQAPDKTVYNQQINS